MDPFEYKEIFSAAYPQDLEPIAKSLSEHGIEGFVETDGTSFNPNMTFNRSLDAVRLFVRREDFEQAEDILVEMGILSGDSPMDGLRQMMGGLDNNELLEIIADAQRQPYDQVAMAYELLEERGVSTETAEVAQKIESITETERQPITLSLYIRILLIVFSLLVPIFGVGAGIIIGLFKGYDNKGAAYWLYSLTDRTLALVVGILSGIFWLGAYVFMS